MIATVTPHSKEGFLIAIRDTAGNTLDRVAISELYIEGETGDCWPKLELDLRNRLKLVR